MSLQLHYDSETSSMIQFREPSGSPGQPHIVQLAACLVDTSSRSIVSSMDVIVRPIDWVFDQQSQAVHGISLEEAMDVGVPEEMALEMLLALWGDGRERVAYNASFDKRIIRIAMKRYGYDSDDFMMDKWADKDTHLCTMLMAQKALGLGKWPKLEDIYLQLIGKPYENAHRAMPDTLASMEVYWKMLDMEAGCE